MTGKDRLTRLFNGKEIDRVPIYLLFQDYAAPFYTDVWSIPVYKPIVARVYETNDFIDRRVFDLGFCYNSHPGIEKVTDTQIDGDVQITTTRVGCGDVWLEKSVIKTSDSTTREPYIKEPSDLGKILELPYRQPQPVTAWFFDEAARFGDRGLMGVRLDDPISLLHGLCDETEFTVLCYTETEAVDEFLSVMYERAESVYRYFLERGVGPIYWIEGAEYAGPPLLPPACFRQLVTGYEKRLVDLVRDYDMWTMIHCHGRMKEIADDFRHIAADSIHPVEGPPMGNITLTEAREKLGPDMIITGNIQYGDIWSMTADEIEQCVKDILNEAMGNPFILATTGGPSNPNINQRVVDNYLRIMDTALAVGKY